MRTSIHITTQYITLGQALKLSDCIDSGGFAKLYLQEQHVTVNGTHEQRRGRKLYDGDVVRVLGVGDFMVVQEDESS